MLELHLWRNGKSFASAIVCRPCLHILLDTKVYQRKESDFKRKQIYVEIFGVHNH